MAYTVQHGLYDRNAGSEPTRGLQTRPLQYVTIRSYDACLTLRDTVHVNPKHVSMLASRRYGLTHPL